MGRVYPFGACTQSCQFTSPGQKSFHLLKQLLCTTNAWPTSRLGGGPQAPGSIHIAVVSRPAPLLPDVLTIDPGPFHSPCSLFPLKTVWKALSLPADHWRGRRLKDTTPSLQIKVILRGMVREMLFAGGVNFVKEKPGKVGSRGERAGILNLLSVERNWGPDKVSINSKSTPTEASCRPHVTARTWIMISLLPWSVRWISLQQNKFMWILLPQESHTVSFHCF